MLTEAAQTAGSQDMAHIPPAIRMTAWNAEGRKFRYDSRRMYERNEDR